MTAAGASALEFGSRREWLVHLALIGCVSAGFESLFVHHGIGWLFDEGWPLYAAMQLHHGGVLYDDVFFLFPPGHLLPAWIAYSIAPPGVVLARIFYAGFNVALCWSVYALSRDLMRPVFALLAALLLALAAPRSHLVHVLFGYRYLVFSALALIAFSVRLRSGDRRWMGVAGIACGIALYFRLTPAFAVSCGIGIAAFSAHRDWRDALRDNLAYAVGIAVIAVPVLTWFATGVGLEALWDQAVLRILPLQAAQDMPVPRLQLPGDWNREAISEWFVALQYRLYPALYAVYATALAALWLRSARAGRRFDHALLVAVVVWGGVYLLRALGRSDEHHLTTALPPVCILLAHAASLFFGPPEAHLRRSRALPAALACAGLVGAWVYLQGSDRYFGRELRGRQPLRCLDGRVFVRSADDAQRLDRSVVRIATLAGPDERVLDLTHSPLIHVLSGRLGPGFGDVVTPGVFADPRELRDFVARLDAAPPALVLWPRRPFDDLPSRSLRAHAPLLADWVQRNYERVGGDRTREVLLRRRPAR